MKLIGYESRITNQSDRRNKPRLPVDCVLVRLSHLKALLTGLERVGNLLKGAYPAVLTVFLPFL
ncbi:MAG: hypothetical protein WA815_09470, partial [Terracidiphilus sp.]